MSSPAPKVCILTSAHAVFDDRIFHKEAKSLVNAGYNVVLVAQHNKQEVVEGVKILPLPKPKNRFKRMTKTVFRLLRLALKENAAIYHFHDPELIPVGVTLKLFNKKIIYDVHEEYPKQILTKEWIGNKTVRRAVSFVFHIFEQVAVTMIDGIVAATPYIAKNFPKEKTVLVRNLPVLELIDNAVLIREQKARPAIIYAGGLSRIRGIREIIQAMEGVGDRAELWLLGEWETEQFSQDCAALEGWKYTRYLGFVSLDEVYRHMKIADIGISLLYPMKNYLTSLPVKAYEYMACSLPMVMSDFPYWRETFGECALFADPYSPDDIVNKILYLLENPDKAKKLSDRGAQLTKEKCSWEAESKNLLDLYKALSDADKTNK